jgi:hypothetical protein
MSLKSVGVAILATIGIGAWVSAQVFRPPQPVASPTVIFGSDFGFRLEARDGNDAYGKLVVRVDGEWVEVNLLNEVRPRLGSN